MVRAGVNGSNKRLYRDKARALGLQLGGAYSVPQTPSWIEGEPPVFKGLIGLDYG